MQKFFVTNFYIEKGFILYPLARQNKITMEERHRRAIQQNFTSLVEQTDLDMMVSALYERGVFSEQMIEQYKVKFIINKNNIMFSTLTCKCS